MTSRAPDVLADVLTDERQARALVSSGDGVIYEHLVDGASLSFYDLFVGVLRY